MKILIGIPTYKRHEKLKKCLESIWNSTHKDIEVIVCCDGNDTSTYDFLKETYYKQDDQDIPYYNHPFLDIVVQPDFKYVIGAWNRIVKENINTIFRNYDVHVDTRFSGFMGLCDDIELYPDTIEEAVKTLKEVYPDTDGVIGLKQECPGRLDYTFKWFGQTLMGREFIERYKPVNYQICCPAYKWAYQDEEMWEYAKSLGKFYECKESKLKHYHPSFLPEYVDETHKIVREGPNSPREHDLKIYERRKKLGLVWGKSFSL